MIDWFATLLLAVSVALLAKCFGLVTHSRTVLVLAEESLVIIGDRMRDDDAKETALRRQAFRLFKLFGILVVGGLAAVCLPLIALRLADRLGAVSEARVLAITLSLPFLGAGAAASVLALLACRYRRSDVSAAANVFENRYSTVDRWLHHLAFAGGPVQIALSGWEDRGYRRRLARVRTGHPVFITSLPRAGTTLLLNLCAQRQEFIAHTYRRMPFVLTPLWWERFSRFFRVADAPRERAHGDGLLVSADSPEALEEMLWLNFWPEHYEPARIRPWMADEAHPEFAEFFPRHVRKLIAASTNTDAGNGVGRPRRYVSKNNANIARIAWLARTFPEARFVVPFRSPLQHAASLLRQHRRFLEIHRQDAFARHYMAGIGHFDFGANLRPIDFDGWTLEDPGTPTTELAYWLRYWLAAYRQLALRTDENVRWVDFDALCAAPAPALTRLADFLELSNPESFIAGSGDIRPPRPHEVMASHVPAALLNEARALHFRLTQLAGTTRAYGI